MVTIITSTILIFSAPAMFWWVLKLGIRFTFLNRLFLIVLAGFVFLRLLPDSFNRGGWWGIIFIVLGVALPTFAESQWRQTEGTSHGIMLTIGYLGFAVHVFLDGHTLSMFEKAPFAEDWLKWIVVSHRLPESLIVWWTCFPRFGWIYALGILVSIAGFSVAGFLCGFAISIPPNLAATAGWISQSLLAGSLLHLSFHRASTIR